MSRIRSIKPEFWTSAQVMECSPIARLFFIGLWNFCDDHGRHPASEKQLKALIFPGDDMTAASIRGLLDELSSNELITLYVIGGKEYLQVTGWKHQKIDRPQPSKYPGADTASLRLVAERSSNALDGREGIGRDRKGDSPLNPPLRGEPDESPVPTEGAAPVDQVEPPDAPEPSAPAPKRRVERGTRLADGWKPNDEGRAFAVEKLGNTDARKEFRKFQNYWIAKPGAASRKVDWDRTWLNWVITAAERPATRGQPPPTGTHTFSL